MFIKNNTHTELDKNMIQKYLILNYSNSNVILQSFCFVIYVM